MTTPIGYDAFHCAYYAAGGERTADCTIKLSEDTKTLMLSGKVVGTVEQLSDVFILAHLSADDCATRNTSLQHAISFATSRPESQSDNLFLTFYHTIVAGKDDLDPLRYPDSFNEVLSLLCDEATGASPSLPGQTYSRRHRKASSQPPTSKPGPPTARSRVCGAHTKPRCCGAGSAGPETVTWRSCPDTREWEVCCVWPEARSCRSWSASVRMELACWWVSAMCVMLCRVRSSVRNSCRWQTFRSADCDDVVCDRLRFVCFHGVQSGQMSTAVPTSFSLMLRVLCYVLCLWKGKT